MTTRQANKNINNGIFTMAELFLKCLISLSHSLLEVHACVFAWSAIIKLKPAGGRIALGTVYIYIYICSAMLQFQMFRIQNTKISNKVHIPYAELLSVTVSWPLGFQWFLLLQHAEDSSLCSLPTKDISMTIHAIDLIQSSSNQDCNFSDGQIDFPIAKHSNCCQL